MAFIPETSVLIAYSLACLILFITPGPDMSLFLAKTMSGGRRAGIAAMTGTMLGCVVHSLLAAFGISALLAASPAGFLALKVVGGAYLLWLAIDAIRHGSAVNVDAARAVHMPFWRTFALGVGSNLTNPKVVLFYVTFLPQFIDAHDPHAAGKLMFLGTYFVIFTSPLALLLVLGAERLLGLLRRNPRVLRAIDWLFAGVFGAFAARILTATAR
jgi:threonine/homoserine/homoserine lactone efflux protein